MLLPGGCWAVGKAQNTILGVENHSLRCRTARTDSGVLKLVRNLSKYQALGYPGTTGNCRRAENKVGSPDWIKPRARGGVGKEEKSDWSSRESLWLDGWQQS